MANLSPGLVSTAAKMAVMSTQSAPCWYSSTGGRGSRRKLWGRVSIPFSKALQGGQDAQLWATKI
jgi:hypothetical protein